VFKDLDRAPDVDPKILQGIRVGELDRCLPGNMENRIRDRIKGQAQIVVGSHVATNEIGGRVDVALIAGALIVDHAHCVTSRKQTIDKVTSDEPCAAGHKDPPLCHQPSSSRALFPSSRHGLKESEDGRR